MRRISSSSTSVFFAIALLAGTPALCAAQAASNDPYVGTKARYEAAAAQLADMVQPPQGEELARVASDAITASYFAERIPETAELFARYRRSGGAGHGVWGNLAFGQG